MTEETKKPDAILIVDDEKSIRVTLKKILEREGYYVETAPDFHTAKKNIESLSFDLFILDIILPEINGIEFLKKLRDDMQINTPVVFITGEPNIQTSIEALRLGAFDYIDKPVRKEDILKVVKQALDRSRLESELDRAKLKNQLVRGILADLRASLEAEKDTMESLKDIDFKADPKEAEKWVAALVENFEALETHLEKIFQEFGE